MQAHTQTLPRADDPVLPPAPRNPHHPSTSATPPRHSTTHPSTAVGPASRCGNITSASTHPGASCTLPVFIPPTNAPTILSTTSVTQNAAPAYQQTILTPPPPCCRCYHRLCPCVSTHPSSHLPVLPRAGDGGAREAQVGRPRHVTHPVRVPWQRLLLRPHALRTVPHLPCHHAHHTHKDTADKGCGGSVRGQAEDVGVGGAGDDGRQSTPEQCKPLHGRLPHLIDWIVCLALPA